MRTRTLLGALLVIASALLIWRFTSEQPRNSGPSSGAEPLHDAGTAPPSVPQVHPAARYESADDLLAVVEQTEGKTDAVSLGLRARALSECRLLSISPNYFDGLDADGEARYGKNLPLVRAYVARYRERCQTLSGNRKPSAEVTKAALLDAALAGNPWANAKLLPSETHDMSASQADQRLAELLRSKDGDAVAALSDSMAIAREDSVYAPLRGTPLHAYAWQLAGCDLGADCSSSGELMRSTCIFGGSCGAFADYRSLLRNSVLSPEDFSRVEDIERDVLLAIRSGGTHGR